MPNLWKDKDFLKLTPADKQAVMRELDTDYAALPDREQKQVIFQLTEGTGSERTVDVSGMQTGHSTNQRIIPKTAGQRVKEYFSTPNTEYADGPVDFATRIIPKDIANTAYSVATAPKAIYDKFREAKADPQLAAEDTDASLMGGLKFLLQHGAPAAGAAVQDITAPLGGRGLEGLKESWGLHPVTSAAGTIPLVKPVVGRAASAIKNRGANRAASSAVQAERTALSKEFDVPLTVGEIRGSTGTKMVETQLERVPLVGIRGFRKKQGEALKAAAERLVDNLTANGPEDGGAVIHQSLTNRLQKGKDTTRAAYDQFETIAHREGVDTNINPVNMRKAAQELLDEYPDIFNRLPDGGAGGVSGKLQMILRNTDPPAAPKATGGNVTGKMPEAPVPQTFNESMAGIVPEKTAPAPGYRENIAGTLPDQVAPKGGESVFGKIDETGKGGYFLPPEPTKIPLKDLKIFREQLNNLINRAYRSTGAVGNKEIRRLQAIKAALDADANAWATQTGNQSILKAWEGANKTYQREIAPFKEFIIKKATGDEFDTDLMVKTFVKNDRPKLARKLMGLLDDEGKAAVKHSVLKEALDLGMDTAPDVPFSPNKFARKLERYGNTLRAVFTPDELQQVQGFVKLARVAERAGQFAENPPTGLRAGDLGLTGAAGYGLAAEPMTTASVGVAIKTLSFMLTSDTGRKLLTRASKVSEKAPIMPQLVQQFSAQWEKFKETDLGGRLATEAGKIKDKLKDKRGLVGRDIGGKNFDAKAARDAAIKDREQIWRDYEAELDKTRPRKASVKKDVPTTELIIPGVTFNQIPLVLEKSGFSKAEQRAVVQHLREVVDYGEKMGGPKEVNPVFGKQDIQEAINAVVRRGGEKRTITYR